MSEYYDEDEWEERVERFADPGGNSALYPASRDNPRDLPCPTCGWPDRLTGRDVARGYQCDACADAMERGYDIDYYEGGDDEVEEVETGAAREALLALVRYLGDNHGMTHHPRPVTLTLELHSQIRRVLGDDFYREVGDGD